MEFFKKYLIAGYFTCTFKDQEKIQKEPHAAYKEKKWVTCMQAGKNKRRPAGRTAGLLFYEKPWLFILLDD